MASSRLKFVPVRGLALVLLGGWLVVSPLTVQAQFGPLVSPFNAPQAKSQQELDAYLDVITATDPALTVEQMDKFASEYPRSELLAFAFQHQMLAYQRLNDFDGVLRSGRRALELQPANVNTLLTLASAIADAASGRNDEADLLRQAEDYARRSLHSIAALQIPRQISLQEWKTMRADMVAQAHEALGHIATKRGDLPSAISELELAAYGSATPTGRQFFRLGVAYGLAGRNESAAQALQRAADLGPELIRQRSLDALKRMRSPGAMVPDTPSKR